MRSLPPDIAAKVMAAAELIADNGLDGTKIEEIAAVTGVPKATLYYYFDGKEAVLSHIFGVLLDHLGAAVDDALAEPGDALARLRHVVGNHVRVIATHPRAAQALHFDLGRAARLPVINDKTRAAYIEPVTRLLIAGAADGSVKPLSNPRLAAIALLAATSTTAIHSVAIDNDNELSPVADTIIELILEGVRPNRKDP